ncbi:hypothetical protein PGT21_022928 [Puccinia graminis f. sp. tritici]|uniref:Uncharacterized protein n=1 Tax=Puccinia graminis f. sp. tritici TaxID=56615 RepID=A0A5B0PY99_PUCGR|nr:hypothetical protein PGT21_022928 [Puccinia graminis f. sp. tritici]KAA1121051.1 hypothetical protein PGTUg99_029085 [Puccinia graminis f. sp. tritici]
MIVAGSQANTRSFWSQRHYGPNRPKAKGHMLTVYQNAKSNRNLAVSKSFCTSRQVSSNPKSGQVSCALVQEFLTWSTTPCQRPTYLPFAATRAERRNMARQPARQKADDRQSRPTWQGPFPAHLPMPEDICPHLPHEHLTEKEFNLTRKFHVSETRSGLWTLDSGQVLCPINSGLHQKMKLMTLAGLEPTTTCEHRDRWIMLSMCSTN